MTRPQKPMPSPVISLQHLSKTIGKSEILHDISLHLQSGEVFGFLGPNGAGKTTTMKAILGIIEATSGTIEIFGKSPRDILVQSRIGFMPENTYLYKYLTGDEFLDFNGRFYGLSKTKLQERKTWALEKVGLIEARHKKLNTFSK